MLSTANLHPYFMEDFKGYNGLTFVVGMIYFYSFNIFVFMILFNFLLAIICDAFGEVKVGRCKLDPSLKATCFQPLNVRVHTVLSI